MALITHTQFTQLSLAEHPVLQHKITLIRDRNTPHYLFRQLVEEIACLLAYEATAKLTTSDVAIDTPLTGMQAPKLNQPNPVIIPILRAGLGMVAGFHQVIPTALTGHIGLYRDENTLEPQHYYFKIPQNTQNHPYFVCDPMLATGGTASDTVRKLKAQGVTDITFVAIIAAPEGVQQLTTQHPDVPIIAAVLDQHLDEQSYIFPGLGDAGDRLYGTFEGDG